mmetsp:Transcript_32122/g.61550  ORF Transcript_32122/g.61550 Transcript_32122/m.61550 type:complete len:139 (+) Transcript_32122:291-707(+)
MVVTPCGNIFRPGGWVGGYAPRPTLWWREYCYVHTPKRLVVGPSYERRRQKRPVRGGSGDGWLFRRASPAVDCGLKGSADVATYSKVVEMSLSDSAPNPALEVNHGEVLRIEMTVPMTIVSGGTKSAPSFSYLLHKYL